MQGANCSGEHPLGAGDSVTPLEIRAGMLEAIITSHTSLCARAHIDNVYLHSDSFV